MLNFLSFLLNPNNTVVSLLMVMIVLTMIAFVIPAGSTGTDSNYSSVTKSYCLIVTMIPLIWSLNLWATFDAVGHSLQMVVTLERLHLGFGVYSVSLSRTLLTTFLFP